jgi:hypothetical protein
MTQSGRQEGARGNRSVPPKQGFPRATEPKAREAA